MALPPLDNWWTGSYRELTGTNSLTDMAKHVAYELANTVLVSALSWTCVGSSNGATAAALDGVNRWTGGYTTLVTANNTASARSWIVFSKTDFISSNFQILIDMVWSGTASSIKIVLSESAGFTGGSIFARPTATDEVDMGSFPVASSTTGENTMMYRYLFPAPRNQLRLFFNRKTTQDVAAGFFILGQLSDAPAELGANPWVCFVSPDVTAGITRLGSNGAGGNTFSRGKMYFGGAVRTVVGLTLGRATNGSPDLFISPVNSTNGLYDAGRIWVWSEDDELPGLIGRLPDLYHVPQIPSGASGSFYYAQGSGNFAKNYYCHNGIASGYGSNSNDPAYSGGVTGTSIYSPTLAPSDQSTIPTATALLNADAEFSGDGDHPRRGGVGTTDQRESPDREGGVISRGGSGIFLPGFGM